MNEMIQFTLKSFVCGYKNDNKNIIVNHIIKNKEKFGKI